METFPLQALGSHRRLQSRESVARGAEALQEETGAVRRGGEGQPGGRVTENLTGLDEQRHPDNPKTPRPGSTREPPIPRPRTPTLRPAQAHGTWGAAGGACFCNTGHLGGTLSRRGGGAGWCCEEVKGGGRPGPQWSGQEGTVPVGERGGERVQPLTQPPLACGPPCSP